MIKKKLNVMIMKQPQKMRPICQNIEPLLPIEAGKVQERMPLQLVQTLTSILCLFLTYLAGLCF